MRCVFCGEEIGEDSSLCEWCGRRQERLVYPPIEPPLRPQAPPPPPSSSGRPGPPSLDERVIGKPQVPPVPERLPPENCDPPEKAASASNNTDQPLEPAPLKACFRWSEIRSFLRGDPLMLAVFIITGFSALTSLMRIAGVSASPWNFLDFLVIGAFIGIISWRGWAWMLVTLIYGMNAAFFVPALMQMTSRFSLENVLVFLQFTACLFVVVVLWIRRDYF